jgi:sulfur-oxidizing protein SoxY
MLGAAALATASGRPLRAQTALQLDPSTFAKPPVPGTEPLAWPKAAFEATTIEAALAALGVAGAQSGAEILLNAPDIAFARQPIRVSVKTGMRKVDRVVLLADRLAFPLLGVLVPPTGRDIRVGMDIHLPRTSRIRAYVRSELAWYVAQREVKLALERG